MKKGLSSLIATVILIGFGVTLAIFVINWGTDFIKSSQRDVEQQSKEKFSCTTDVAFEIACRCTQSDGYLDVCTFKVINNEDSKINSITYRLFRGGTFIVYGTDSDLSNPSWSILEAWEVSDYYEIPDDGKIKSTQADNIKLEVLVTEIETGGTTINCGSVASNTATCIILS
jgi:hypothetical protein